MIKKANLDPDVLGNYQPVSNFLYLSKLLDRVASEQLWTHMDMNKLQVSFQLALWSQQWPSLCSEWSSLNDWCCKQCLSCFAGLTSAFDKIDHSLNFQGTSPLRFDKKIFFCMNLYCFVYNFSAALTSASAPLKYANVRLKYGCLKIDCRSPHGCSYLQNAYYIIFCFTNVFVDMACKQLTVASSQACDLLRPNNSLGDLTDGCVNIFVFFSE